MSQSFLLVWILTQAAARPAIDAGSAKNQELPVRLLPGAMVATTSELQDCLTRSWSRAWDFTFTVKADDKRKWTKIKNCAEMKRIDPKAATTRPNDAWDSLNAVADWCRAVEAILRARASKRSYIAEVLAAKNPAPFIPASVVDEINGVQPEDIGSDTSSGKSPRASLSWAKADPNLFLEEDQSKDAIGLQGKDWAGTVRYYARGDFNADGTEDVLLEVGIRAFDASQGEARFYIMTRTRPTGVLTVIEQLR
jgi:hypothetical protein